MTIYDGARMNDGEGRVFVCFAPRWWQVWRWVWWLFTRRAKGRIRFSVIAVDGSPMHVDVRTHEASPPPRTPMPKITKGR